jgi:beta-phosphoglucomutase-like phosphatase (HAD superfamily)
MYAETEPLMVEMIARHAEPVPGLLETAAAFRDMGLSIGSTTGYTRPMMEVLMPLARERGYAPDFMACPTDAPAGRPYPFMCWQNAVALKAYPLEAVVKIGDTVSDVHEGLNAGMWTVGLTESGNEMGVSESELAAMDPVKRRERREIAENRLVTAGAHFLAAGIGDCPAIIEDQFTSGLWGTGRRPDEKKGLRHGLPTASRQSDLLLTTGPLSPPRRSRRPCFANCAPGTTTYNAWCGESGELVRLAVGGEDLTAVSCRAAARFAWSR